MRTIPSRLGRDCFGRNGSHGNTAHGKDVDSLVSTVVTLLLSDQVIPENNRDPALSGDWVGYRECHIKSDLLPIYRKPDAGTLRLTRLGSHRELFG